jgi:hypothetical protein
LFLEERVGKFTDGCGPVTRMTVGRQSPRSCSAEVLRKRGDGRAKDVVALLSLLLVLLLDPLHLGLGYQRAVVEVVGLQGAFVHVLVLEQVETLQAADLSAIDEIVLGGDLVGHIISFGDMNGELVGVERFFTTNRKYHRAQHTPAHEKITQSD